MTATIPDCEPSRRPRLTRRQAVFAEFAALEISIRQRIGIQAPAENLAAVDDFVTLLARVGPVFAQFGRYLGTRPDALRPEHCLRLVRTGAIRSMPPGELMSLFSRHFPENLPPWACNLQEDQSRSDHMVHVFTWSDVPEISFFTIDPVFRRAWAEDRPFLQFAGRIAALLWPSVPLRRLVDQFTREVERSLTLEWDTQALRRLEALPPPRPDGRPGFAAPRYAKEFSMPSLLAVEAPRLSGERHLFTPGYPAVDPFDQEAISTKDKETVRLVCHAWLNHAFKCPWFPESPRPENLALTEQGRFTILGGRIATVESELQTALLLHLTAAGSGRTDDAVSAIMAICAPGENDDFSEKMRTILRQMVPFRDGGWGGISRQETLAEHVFAHWRTATELGYEFPEEMVPYVRGFWEIARLAHEIDPQSDLLREGLQQFRAADCYDRLRGLFTLASLAGQGQGWLEFLVEMPGTLNAIAERRRVDEAVGTTSPPRSRPRPSPWPVGIVHFLVLASIGLLLVKLAQTGAVSEWTIAAGLIAFVAVAISLLAHFKETK